MLTVLTRLRERTQEQRVVIAGGVGMNSVANGKVTHSTGFEALYTPGAAADNGTAFGAALHVWHRVLGRTERSALQHLYLGPEYSDTDCELDLVGLPVRFERLAEDQLVDRTARAIADGGIIGWYQGRMEFGARALWNRSLLADPRRADMREIINTKIKFRERFRPFAPSVLEEYVSEIFESPQPSPFMERVLPIRQSVRSLIPAVTHVDGSGRLQTVSKTTNPRYWRLIERFRQLTGVPLLLNTSLNENEPIVNLPREAVACFLRTRMDAIVLQDLYVIRQG
jgi:carbamoyltransferase